MEKGFVIVLINSGDVLGLFLLLLIFPKIVSLVHSQNPHAILKGFSFIKTDHIILWNDLQLSFCIQCLQKIYDQMQSFNKSCPTQTLNAGWEVKLEQHTQKKV